ncbi:MAG: DNA-directed RNA polymerase subunit beta, partial [candidate division WWE3 bacterium GW2011_GWA2_42_9]
EEIKVIVLTSMNGLLDKCAMAAAKQFQTSCLIIQHGTGKFYDGQLANPEPIGNSKLLVFSDFYKKQFVDSGVAEDNVIVVGPVVLDEVVDELLTASAGLEDAQKKEKTILFATSPLVEDNLISKDAYFGRMAKILSDLKKIDGSVILKLHPREKHAGMYRKIMQDLGFKDIIILQNTTRKEFYGLMRGCDSFLNLGSTAAMEAIILDKPVVTIDIQDNDKDDDGVVEFADARRVVVKYGRGGKGSKVEYTAAKFEQTNSDTCFNQYVVVETGQKVKAGDVLVEGPAVNNGELSIGTNMKVAYMIYEGLEFEDGIVISDRLVKEDVLTSIHVSDYQTSVQETKLGPEEITRDIPNVSEESLRNLDEDGIVAIGSKVKSSDILVGKVAPKGEMDLTSEERLLRAIFGEKAKDVRDTSLYMPHGEHGVVIGIKRVTKKDNESLPAGTIERITVYVAQQKKIDVGDKLAGRHGNKGVISAIVPSIDMPMLDDGSTVDIIFSSEAVLKRMNVGQILEASLGMAGKTLGKTYEVPSLQEIPEELIEAELRKAGLPVTGKMKLIDGRNGEYFHNEIVVGDTYILKLIHMSEEKMHARSTGPYSLITQQPLGGKAQFGGQRFGEMEVWALEAYGAANILKEILTIKSDDMLGRTQAYSAMVQGKEIPESSVPETFKLLVRKLNGLGLGLEAYSSEENSSPAEVAEEAIPEVADPSAELIVETASEEISEQEAESEE